MLQNYRYINHVKEQNPSLLITKNQSTTNGAESSSVHWLIWYIRRCILERFIFKIQIGKKFQQVFHMMNFNGRFISFNCNNTIFCIASICKIFMFSFLPWYANDSFILVKFSLIKKGLLLGLNMYFFLTWENFFLLYRACLACLLFTKQIIVLVLPILVSFLSILWQDSTSLSATLTLMSMRISVADSSNWLTLRLSGMPLIITLFLLPCCSRLLMEHSNSTSLCPNLLHRTIP